MSISQIIGIILAAIGVIFVSIIANKKDWKMFLFAVSLTIAIVVYVTLCVILITGYKF
jgi:hypothetical protein